ncbi:MAG: IS66 family insertion sequence element accessory protein TnpA [Patescibacteria group bacterium]
MTKPSRKEENLQKRKIWGQRIHEWQREGISQSEYCRRHNLKDYQFTYWKKRLAVSGLPAVSFLEVQLDSALKAARDESGLKLVLNDQYHIVIERDFDEIAFQRVLAALRRASC